MKPHIITAHRLWKELILPGDRVIDATVGNGYDTLYLASLLNGHGALYGYDIQETALNQARQRLLTLSKEQQQIVFLKKASHVNFEEKQLNLIVYNLGYLPGGDKNVTTQSATTLSSLKQALEIVIKGGAISITCYPGHEEGNKEQQELLKFMTTLPKSEWMVCHYHWLNRTNSPSLLWINRL